MDEREQLEQAIAALEAQRAILGDAVVETAVAPLRQKLAALAAPPQAAPAGEQQRKQVTVLFADVSGFTAMSETLDAEEVTATMNALWSRLDRAIVAQGGRIDKHIGDAVMALFGAPTAREDDPERAIRAALALQAELAAFAAERSQPLAMRLGLNTGPVLLGAVGTTGEYTAMGDAVNVASRLEHAAPVGGILISHDTYRHVRGIFDVTTLEPLTVKGKSEPIRVYLVRGAKPRAFRVTTRGIEGLETRTIGREAELRQMQAATEAVRAGQAHLISVVAEAGTGKSRLLYEYTNWLDVQPFRLYLFKGRATQEMAQLPYALIRDLLAFRFEIKDSDRAAVAREKLEAGLLGFADPDDDDDASVRAHFIGHLIGFDFSGSPHLQGVLGDARQIRDRAFHYLCRFFDDVTRDRPTVLLLEDIHWADAGSLDLIEHLLRERPELPLLVVGLTRPTLFEQRPKWGEGPATHLRINLQPLSEQIARQLVAEILRKLPHIPPALENLIVRRAEGSPFFVEELIKMLIEEGVIQTGEEQWSVSLDRLATARVPATLTGVVQARLDGLPPAERDTLQQASVVGRVFWSNVVERLHRPDVAQHEPAALTQNRLKALSGKELVFPHDASAFAGSPEYIFRHAILHDVTYESVLKRLRRIYHAQVAEALIEVSGERVREYAGRIGEHFERAEAAAQAAEWYWRAGQQAQETYLPEAAANYYQKAGQFLKVSGSQPAWRFDLYESLGDVLDNLARYGEAGEAYAALRAEAESANDLVAQSRAWVGLAKTQGNQGDHRSALESATRAEMLAQTADSPRALSRALFQKGRTLFRLGQPEKTLALGGELNRLSDALGDRPQAAATAILFGAVHYILGHYDDAVREFEGARATFQESGDRRRLMDVASNLGVIAHARGDYETAFKYTQEALEIAREIGERDGELVFTSNLGAAQVGLGDYAKAEAGLREVIEMAGAGGSWVLSDTYRLLAEACLGQSRAAEALTAAQQALALGQSGGVQEYIAAAWRVLGQVAAQQQTPIMVGEQAYSAEACFAESVRVCTEIGMEGGKARALKEWAAYELRRGELERGRALWQEARAIYARLGAEREVQRMDVQLNDASAPGL
jgi:class 3 adenylate cyclase/tetratricopeptide (TPR) repeat protein